MTPTTAAGRALLEGMLKFAPDEDPAIPRVREGLRRDILAIEAEVRADLIERLEREPHHWECFREGERGDRRYKCNCWHQTVLALLRDDKEAGGE